MDHASQLPGSFPWRTAALVTGAIAALELAALVVGGAVVYSHPLHRLAARVVGTAHAPAHRTPPAAHQVAGTPAVAHVKALPLRPRSRVTVLVLNGNGVQGAARTAASRLQSLGYRIGGTENAARHDYARSMVMYAQGYVREARRLGHDVGVRLVAPADGMTRAALRASPLVLLLGS